MRLTKFDYSKIAILIIAVLVIFINFNTKPWKKNKVIHDDIISYYCYLPAAIIHHDLSFQFTKANPDFYEDKYWPSRTSEGKEVVKMTMGLAIMYLPFFFIGHTIALLGNFPPDGYSSPYQIMLQLSALFNLLLALFILRKVLLKWFESKIVGLVLITTFLGTNLMHYSTQEATMSHVYNFSLFALFFYLTVKFWELPKAKHWVFLGLLTGLITLVRPSNGVILLFFIFWEIDSFKKLNERFFFFLGHWKFVLLSAILAFTIWIPQLLYWKLATGNWLYYSYNNEGFFFLNPHITDGLFNYRKGWLIYTPLMAVPLVGLFFMTIKKRWNWFWPLIIFISANIYIIFSWWCWWYGGGLGARTLIESYALLTLPFAYFLTWINKKTLRRILGYFSITIITLYGLFVNFQYHYMTIHWDSMNKSAFWDSFLRLKPSGRLDYYLQTPDYESAIIGKKEVTFNKKYTSPPFKVILENNCDSAENKIYTKVTHSGKHSIAVEKSNPFGLTTEIVLKPNQKYIVQIWRYGNSQAMLVVQSDTMNFYINSKTTLAIDDSNWDLISIEFTVPNADNQVPFKVYAWNPYRGKAYFDDLTIGEAL